MVGWHHGLSPRYGRSGRSAERRAGVDVSAPELAAPDGEPPSDWRPIFVRQQVVEPYVEVIADPDEAAGQQMAVARDVGQILMEA